MIPKVEKILIHELAQRIKDGTTPQYLLEDCVTQEGLALFKRGKKIQATELKQLIHAGFYYIWVSDESPKADIHNFTYNFKLDLSRNLGKVMHPIDEQEAKKPTSKVNYLERNDLLRQIIEVIQIEGTSYLAEKLFGYSFRQILSIQSTIKNSLVQAPPKIELADHICLGNKYKQSPQKEEELKNQAIYSSNFITRNMIHMVLGFMVTLVKISKSREKLQAPSFSEEDLIKRPGYDKNEIREAILSALFSKYGLLHYKIHEILNRNTQSFLDAQGNLQGSGFTHLNSANQLILEKYCNVSHHFFTSMKEKGFAREMGRGILHYHNQRLNGLGYPTRKHHTEKSTHKNKWRENYEETRDLFERRIFEPTRLAGIVSFFVDSLFQSPLHLPFKRDSLVRHMLINSSYIKNPTTKELDKNGLLEIQSQYRQEKAFDGFLVEEFLRSIHLYKIGELVPLYRFRNFHTKVYDAQIIAYNDMPHRPIVEILSPEGEKGKELDLSNINHSNLYIGEYTPSLDFQDVLDEFFEEKLKHGILNLEQRLEQQKFQRLSKKKRETQKQMDAIWKDEPIPRDTNIEEKPVSVDELISILPPGLETELPKNKSLTTDSQKKKSNHEDETIINQNEIAIDENETAIKLRNLQQNEDQKSTTDASLDRSEKEHYYILDYIEAKDPRKSNGSKEKVPKYIVQIKKSVPTVENSTENSKSIVTFLHYVQQKDGKTQYIKDRNCGKDFNLAQFPFFELGVSISKSEIS